MNDYLAIAEEALKRYYARQAQAGSPAAAPALSSPNSKTEAVIHPVEAKDVPCPASDPSTLKGQAVELWRDGKRFFVVTDDVDAQEAIQRFGARRGEIWTSGELELVARLEDQATRDAVGALKRELDGSLSHDDGSRGVSPEESKATALNRLLNKQGIRGRDRNKANIKPATIEHRLERRAESER